MPPATVPAQTQLAPQQSYQQQIVPQSGTSYLVPSQQLQSTPPPALSRTPATQPATSSASPLTATPAPSLRPIPETPRTFAPDDEQAKDPAAAGSQEDTSVPATGAASAPAFSQPAANAASGASFGAGMPVIPGSGPSASTGAFPKLLAPSQHTTSTWSTTVPQQPAPLPTLNRTYPTALIPAAAPY